ncbi:hypothetical protein KM427_04870 [Nocardioides sp. LMS-CY]|uniref:Uncharacterized protein n=1 Tax=Nocardioides soli TaxID=1036020 RepID=A0A7W4VWB4_9ACTN|nr:MULTISPECIES: hypothetical protein [Nocardioides]MBB3042969.1 hypothetical protein [Nocardioides soli]QWF23067.1 hypothetical protein KM427_04870 [Nocardioides sp. LMS-CY]
MADNSIADAAPLDPLGPDGSASTEAATGLVPTSGGVHTTPLGFGMPLSIRILSMYAGQDRHKKLLLSSAVKSRAVYDAAPRAMHYVFDEVPSDRLLKPSPAQAGSRIVYYSPAVLDTALDLEVRFSFDDFDLDQATKWLEVASAVAELPVFAVSTTLGGAGGAAAGKSVLYFAKQAVQFALNAIDGWVDNDNDWAPTWTLSLDRGSSGLAEAEPGYVLLYGDGEAAEVLAPVDGDLNDQQLLPRSKAYRVDPTNGTVVYADQPNQVVLDEPYVLAYVNGAEEPDLAGWKAAAVSAALTEKFLNVSGPTAADVGELLTGFNDMYMARRYSETTEKLKSKRLSEEERKVLTRKRDAFLKNIQDDDVKDIVDPQNA